MTVSSGAGNGLGTVVVMAVVVMARSAAAAATAAAAAAVAAADDEEADAADDDDDDDDEADAGCTGSGSGIACWSGTASWMALWSGSWPASRAGAVPTLRPALALSLAAAACWGKRLCLALALALRSAPVIAWPTTRRKCASRFVPPVEVRD